MATTSALRKAGPQYDERQLWISLADLATMRRRLVGVAQQVRMQLDGDGVTDAELPELIFPHNEKQLRHGFWFMRFERPTLVASTLKKLQGQPFASACGTVQGQLFCSQGRRNTDLRATLNVTQASPDPVREWLRATFSPYGRIRDLRTPRLKNNWDQGFGFVEYDEAEAAEAALEALDGTMSPVPGCRMYVDYANASRGDPLFKYYPPSPLL